MSRSRVSLSLLLISIIETQECTLHSAQSPCDFFESHIEKNVTACTADFFPISLAADFILHLWAFEVLDPSKEKT